jgi:hypothetical protein
MSRIQTSHGGAPQPAPDRHDDHDVTVRLVRPPRGPAYLVTLRGAVAPWVLRRKYLLPCDLD